MSNSNKVIIVGAGVGGLSAAVALRRAGIEAVVLEGAPQLIDVGCVQLWSNGMVALEELGLADEVYTRGLEMHTQEFRTSSGRILFDAAIGKIAKEHGALPPANIRRLDLINIIYEALDEGVVQFGATCTGFEQDDEGVTVLLADGREERAALLVAADGIASGLRMQLFGGPKPRFSGAEVMRAVIPFEHPLLPAGKFSLTFGRGDRFGLIHTSQDVLCWFAIIMIDRPGAEYGEAERGGAAAARDERKKELFEHYADFPEPARAVIEATPENEIYRADVRDIVPLKHWSVGRVTLLGDAAHAATPYLGRGAGEAVEDSVALTECLTAAGDLTRSAIESALREYEARRRPATAKTQTTAWRFGKFAGRRGPVAARLRPALMSTIGRRAVTRAIHTEFGELGRRRPARAGAETGTAHGGSS